MKLGDRFGAHRVLEPAGALPKAARRLDNETLPLDNELGIRVRALHITSASFNRLWQEAGQDAGRFASAVLKIVREHGKFQDPVTGSGGVLLGAVDFVGPALKADLRPGEQIVTLVSLALTPLRLDRVGAVDPALGQVEVDGYATLFESALWARLPTDLPTPVALLALDVAGAPAYAARYVQPGQRVLVVGGGKAGLLFLHEARKRLGETGRVVLVEKDEWQGQLARSLGLADELVVADATQSLDVFHGVGEALHGSLADVSFNCANVPDTEMATILCTRDGGRAVFFSMATDFSRAALGAEGAGKDVELIIGNGYLPGHAEMALQALRENRLLREHFSGLLSRSDHISATNVEGGVTT